jgi:hypothetical protein
MEGCKNCAKEVLAHQETKTALDKSIALSNMLLEEIKKLDHQLQYYQVKEAKEKKTL